MKIACWNIRGFHKPLKQKSVQTLFGSHKIDVFVILESKLDEKTNMNLMRIRFGGMKVTHNFLLNNKGCVLVFWNPQSVELDVIYCSAEVIHAWVNCVRTKKVFCASFVYAFNTIVQRRVLWEELQSISDTCSLPWILMGDFNNVLSQEEKKGGLAVKNYEILVVFFTWMSPTVCSKIDRRLAKKQPKPFKFLNMWSLSEDFLDIVKNKWCFGGFGTTQYRLKQLFKELKRPLKVLNGKKFFHITSHAKNAIQRLEEMQEEMLQVGIMLDGYKETKKSAEMLLEAERHFMAQQAKFRYLKECDRCTKFFHDLIKRNNKNNSIAAIQTQDGNITIDSAEIAQQFVGFYEGLLETKGDRIPVDRELVNAVKEALLDIDDDKAPGTDGFGSLFFKTTWNIISNDVFAAIQEFFFSWSFTETMESCYLSSSPEIGSSFIC
ncbi:uncharacterized protein [Primulina eburnea]|uniref:uncharacterized protein n=1 Tax=Primulina eburnea TaxID=1245227 RepID=UPI003C6C1F0F